jgi:hypothetical protein
LRSHHLTEHGRALLPPDHHRHRIWRPPDVHSQILVSSASTWTRSQILAQHGRALLPSVRSSSAWRGLGARVASSGGNCLERRVVSCSSASRRRRLAPAPN